ncbi:MAG: DUF2802 domain-containing protein [Gammaproteobacteria bacterium]|nr:DUF2802 domain-containing protein [Gammaproteobacteria bacterium]
MNSDMTMVVMGIVLGLFVLMNIPVWLKVRRLSAHDRQRNAELQTLQNDLRVLCAGAVGVGDHVARVEQQLRRLAERQDQLDLRDPATQSYRHAIKLAQKGANVEELMSASGLVRGEAELLMRLYRANA